ncbi:hypothetical protein [Bradyrhizobium cenepequi]|uniref:hypothetical protein n=1 Tax=Bradyrhizobium cenepequi TaxID=2821403 RepID=UPI001CE38F33|nr:hypothetical protein [Bradyrhizobium cenepequi]MCA6108957.1 hypothetical protein [Bradyrhizobium cenepequi]
MRGLLAASLAAWTFFMVVATATPLLATGVWSLMTDQDATWPSSRQIFGSFGFAAAVGLPISLIICFAVGYPAWKFASTHGLTTRWDAVKIGAALYLLVTVGGHIAIYMGRGSYSYAQGGVLLTKDSVPTFQGVVFDLFLTLFYAADGAVAGLAAWLVGGSKSVVSIHAQR